MSLELPEDVRATDSLRILEYDLSDIDVNNQKANIDVQLWDTSGKERYVPGFIYNQLFLKILKQKLIQMRFLSVLHSLFLVHQHTGQFFVNMRTELYLFLQVLMKMESKEWTTCTITS